MGLTKNNKFMYGKSLDRFISDYLLEQGLSLPTVEEAPHYLDSFYYNYQEMRNKGKNA